MQKLKDPALGFSPLFGTVQTDTLLRDALPGAISDASLHEMLAFLDPQEILCSDWPITPAVQELPCADSLFLPGFDINVTEEIEEIRLEGIARLPVITNDQARGLRGRENLTSFLRALAELKPSAPTNSYATEKR